MADISDDEQIQKPKRVMTDKQKEALKRGRELSKANREAQKASAPKLEDKPKLKRATKKVEEVREPSPEVAVEIPKGKRVSRKPKVEEVREPSPEPVREPSPPPVPKKTRTPRQKKTEPPVEPIVAPSASVRQRKALQFV